MARPLEALDLDRLARESGLVHRRARKLSARILLSGLLSAVTARCPSLMLIAAVASAVGGQVVSKQAVWKRLNHACADFLGYVLMALTTRTMGGPQPAETGCFTGFSRVLLQDSTLLALPARLVAIRVPPDIAAERRRQARANRDRRCRPSPASLALLDWEIFVTNVPRERWNTRMAVQVYGLRWRIETLFKLWKRHFKLPDLPQNVSADQVRCLVLARLIHIVIFHRFWVDCRCQLDPATANRLSILKLGKLWTDALRPLFAPLFGASENPNLLSQILARHATYDKRKRKSFTEILQALCEQPPHHYQLLS